MEIIEECRDLTVMEWNFKETLKEKLSHLLEQQRVYWKQRGKVRWVKDGDAGTKLFHANATLRHRGNLINELTSRDEVTVTDHKTRRIFYG